MKSEEQAIRLPDDDDADDAEDTALVKETLGDVERGASSHAPEPSMIASRLKQAFSAVLTIAVVVLLFNSFRPQPVYQAYPERPSNSLRKTVVLSGVKKGNYTWLQDIPEEWEVMHYVPDDPEADHATPMNHGREGMVYLTYIINNYYSLPDYIVFIHGHEREWHQPEPLPWMLRALNLDVVRQETWTSLRCQTMPGCSPDWTRLHTKTRFPDGTRGWQAEVFEGLWNFIYRPTDRWYQEMPDEVGAPCCAQFAASKEAILGRPLDFWKRARLPMMRDIEEPMFKEKFGKDIDEWRLGAGYEIIWHLLFGMPAVTCPERDFCHNTLYRGMISCDGETTDWPNSRNWSSITCEFDQSGKKPVPVVVDTDGDAADDDAPPGSDEADARK